MKYIFNLVIKDNFASKMVLSLSIKKQKYKILIKYRSNTDQCISPSKFQWLIWIFMGFELPGLLFPIWPEFEDIGIWRSLDMDFQTFISMHVYFRDSLNKDMCD